MEREGHTEMLSLSLSLDARVNVVQPQLVEEMKRHETNATGKFVSLSEYARTHEGLA